MKNIRIIFTLLFLQAVMFIGFLYPIERQFKKLADMISDNASRIIASEEVVVSEVQNAIGTLETSDEHAIFIILINQDEDSIEYEDSIECEDSVEDTDIIQSENVTEDIYSDDDYYSDFYGRLYIPDANVDVALYYGWYQYITDRVDSANIYTWINCDGETIADHDYQEFWKLFNAEIGTTGYIKRKDGSIITIECTDVFDGHNITSDVTDENGVSAYGRADYMMYTCRDGWRNVRFWLWKKII